VCNMADSRIWWLNMLPSTCGVCPTHSGNDCLNYRNVTLQCQARTMYYAGAALQSKHVCKLLRLQNACLVVVAQHVYETPAVTHHACCCCCCCCCRCGVLTGLVPLHDPAALQQLRRRAMHSLLAPAHDFRQVQGTFAGNSN
jgi:hypothetical protein